MSEQAQNVDLGPDFLGHVHLLELLSVEDFDGHFQAGQLMSGHFEEHEET
jgi:hypothetical protein